MRKCIITVKLLIINITRSHWRCKMRMKRTTQIRLNEIFAKHAITDELRKISGWMDAHGEILDWVESDIRRHDVKATGRTGMRIDTILRSGFLLRYPQWTYNELAFHLMDSAAVDLPDFRAASTPRFRPCKGESAWSAPRHGSASINC